MKYGSLINIVQEGAGNRQKPEVGMGVTLLMWSDRHPMTIIEVGKGGNSFVAQDDNWKRIDNNGMSECQEYEYTPNPEGGKQTFRRGKDGRFYTKGGRKNGNGCILGHRERYYDFSF